MILFTYQLEYNIKCSSTWLGAIQNYSSTGRIQFVVMTTLPLKFKGFYIVVQEKEKSKMRAQWRNYLGNLRKICDIITPTI